MTPMSNTSSSSSRKMRRTRDAGTGSSSGGTDAVHNNVTATTAVSGFDLYNVQGDSAAALAFFRDSSSSSAAEAEAAATANAAATTAAPQQKQQEAPSSLSLAAQYNCLLLSQLVARDNLQEQEQQQQQVPTEVSVFMKQLQDMDDLILQPNNTNTPNNNNMSPVTAAGGRSTTTTTATTMSSSAAVPMIVLSPRKVLRNELVLAYNRALVLYASGSVQQCAALCAEKLSPVVVLPRMILPLSPSQPQQGTAASAVLPAKSAASAELDGVASRMAFLLLECILALAVGKNSGLDYRAAVAAAASCHDGHTNNTSQGNTSTTTATEMMMMFPPVDKIVEWLEKLLNNNSNSEQELQLKFLLPVYKSRLALAEFDGSTGKRVDSQIRSARKDMKTAMEVFQQKLLRPSFGGGGAAAAAETGSVVSSANSEENQQVEPQPPSPSSVVLQKLNQSALSLKAHLEQLKGNTKKSLILCSEALGATTTSDADAVAYYEALHSNNLAVVYETNNRRHLALHALTKSLRANSKNNIDSNSSDNMKDCERPTTVSALFHSDGTARPDQTLSILYNAAICSLRARNYTSAYECMAACISHSDIFCDRPGCWLRMAEACIGIFTELRRQNNRKKFSMVDFDGETRGIVVDNAVFSDDVGVVREELVAVLGSPEDMEQVKRNPLLRALASLEHVIQNGDQMEFDALMSARLSISYVYLAFGDHRSALVMAKIVLDAMESVIANDSTESDTLRRLHKRQVANARMYAAEASCALGEMADAMAFLVGDGKDDAFDRLASDLSGVTFETASTSEQAKRRLAKAQTMVRSSACAVTAAMGNNRAAKQLAHSANAMEDAYSSNRERSSARRALIYTLLREGNQSSALTMLLSLR